MWIISNVILIIAGVCCIDHALEINAYEKHEAWYYFVSGVLIIIIGLVSSLIKWWFS